ncbi:hypothetical protein [Mesorhizobium sp. SP-1A]|jgi:hypothetical protein|uniref:hypothetical protein n=1 Tax=Mesorhizobium sp. SP-1A TaxID=3077840 RepID=UPI0028F707D2|nr:hypothetical protein [Mesorhizobium sp. SP-1A]
MIEATPKLDELLRDPVIKLVMASDGVQPDEVRLLLERARERGNEIGPMLPPAHMIGESHCANWFCG